MGASRSPKRRRRQGRIVLCVQHANAYSRKEKNERSHWRVSKDLRELCGKENRNTPRFGLARIGKLRPYLRAMRRFRNQSAGGTLYRGAGEAQVSLMDLIKSDPIGFCIVSAAWTVWLVLAYAVFWKWRPK